MPDPTDRIKAMHYLEERGAAGEVVTGLRYVDPRAVDLHEHLGTVGTPLNKLDVRELCPGSVALGRINASLRSPTASGSSLKTDLSRFGGKRAPEHLNPAPRSRV